MPFLEENEKSPMQMVVDRVDSLLKKGSADKKDLEDLKEAIVAMQEDIDGATDESDDSDENDNPGDKKRPSLVVAIGLRKKKREGNKDA